MSEKGRIVISNYDSIFNPHYSGGGAAAVHEIAKRLAKKHEVIVFAGSFGGKENSYIDGVNYHFLGNSFFGPVLGHIFFVLSTMIKSVTEDYSFWIEGSCPPTSFTLLPLLTKKKVISWVHMFAGAEMYRKYKIPFQIVEKLLAKNYKYFLVSSNWARNKIENEYKVTNTEIGILPNGIPALTPKNYDNVSKESYFLYLGRLEVSQKGLDLMLSALNKLHKHENVKVKIAGSGPSKEVTALKNLIKKYNLQENVELLGRIEGEEKESFLENCISLLLPSRFDTYPLVVLEAFSHAKPVVLFDLPQLDWVPEDASIKIKCYSTGDYANAVVKLLDDKEVTRKLGKAANDFASDNTWDKQYEKLEKFLSLL